MAKILVIDDEKNLRENVKTALELNNYEVFTSENGTFGLESAINNQPDLILCDIMMPDHDGFWVLENIRKNKKLVSVPFIFLTAKVEREDLRKGMNLGADDYITKPFKINELLSAIEIRLNKTAALKKAASDDVLHSAKIDKDKFILLNTGKNIEPIQINLIECIFADNIFTQILLTNQKIIAARKSLAEWEELLPDSIFIRIHRSTIINMNYIKSIEKWFNQTMIIHMQNYEKSITMSRGYVNKLKGRLIL